MEKNIEVRIIAFQMAIEICKQDTNKDVFKVYNKIKKELIDEN